MQFKIKLCVIELRKIYNINANAEQQLIVLLAVTTPKVDGACCCKKDNLNLGFRIS
jgi:hypothetical protein